MTFTSGIFFVFLPILLIIYWLLPRASWQNILLLAGSYLFYGWLHPWYAVLLGISTVVDYVLTKEMINKPQARRRYLLLSLLVNLGVLAFFKYNGFFTSDLVEALSKLGIASPLPLINIVLPAGLSFYTLKKLAYAIDVSRGTLQPTASLIDFAVFISFFPQVLAGPIDRAQLLLPQIKKRRVWESSWFHDAWPLIVSGFFKKLVIADSLKVMVDRIFYLEEPTKLLVICATLAFSVQILADFSAYTDLARGFACLLGFQTSENFKNPYLSLTPTHFWNRWHITLSNWLRDYLFFPIRRALLKRRFPDWLATVVPPLVTMFVCGIWHGVGTTFILWGVFHGFLIAIYQLIGLGGAWKPANALKSALAWMIMFTLILFSWLLFRAPSVVWLVDLLWKAPWMHGEPDLVVGLIILSMTFAYSLPLVIQILLARLSSKWNWVQGGFYAVLLIVVIIYLNSSPPNFIYFQF